MTERLLKKGEKGKHQCDTCLKLFDHTGDGKWVPTTCPSCSEKRTATPNKLYRKIQIIEDDRKAKKGHARIRMINQVRTDSLESKIAHLESIGDHNGAAAIRWVARDIGAPIDESLIDLQTKVRKSYI